METALIISLVLIIGSTYAGIVLAKTARRERIWRAHETAVQAASPTELIKDKFGSEFELCKKCKVPVILDGIELRCLNGCALGTAYVVSRDERPSPENNYNPTVVTNCSKCRGSGQEFFQDAESWCARECDQCNGKGCFQRKKYSSDEEIALSRPILVTVDNEGRTDCPKCRVRFYVTDKNALSAGRHKRCGQKLMMPDVWKTASNPTMDTES